MKHTKAHLPRIRRVLCLVLCLALCLPLSACSASPFDFSIEETILYEKGGFVITAKASKPKEHFEIDLTVENNANIDGTIAAFHLAINGIMVDNGLFTENHTPYTVDYAISPGETTNISLPVEDTWLKENNIQQVRSIQVQFYVIRKGESTVQINTGPLLLKTNHFNETEPKASGQEIYREEDIAVYSLGGTKFMVKNESDVSYAYHLKDLQVNGVRYDEERRLIFQTTFSHCVSSFDLEIKESFLKKNRMNRISELQFHFEITPQDKSAGEYSTDIITVTLDENGALRQ